MEKVMEKIIEIENFSFSINRKRILKDISLSIEQGEYVSIVGPNGAGKTTLIKCLNRILRNGTGTIKLAGKNIDEYRRKILPGSPVMFPKPMDIIFHLRYGNLS